MVDQNMREMTPFIDRFSQPSKKGIIRGQFLRKIVNSRIRFFFQNTSNLLIINQFYARDFISAVILE